jgi:hypothetical protein
MWLGALARKLGRTFDVEGTAITAAEGGKARRRSLRFFKELNTVGFHCKKFSKDEHLFKITVLDIM